MPRRWNEQEEREMREELMELYVRQNKAIFEVGRTLGLRSSNKVRDQVGVPDWIFTDSDYQKRFVRGFFDTDGSIYLLKHFNAPQMLFKNRSIPLLDGTRQILLNLDYHPSRVSGYSVYLTRRAEIERYVLDIGFGNAKHLERAARFGVRSALAMLPTVPPGVVRERQAQYHSEQWVTAPLTLN